MKGVDMMYVSCNFVRAASRPRDLGVRVAGMPELWSAGWSAWALPRVAESLRAEHDRFVYESGASFVQHACHLFVPEEMPGAAPAGYLPMWEDEVLLRVLVEGVRRGGLGLENALAGERLSVFPEWYSHFNVVNYLAVRNLLERDWYWMFQHEWPDAHTRRCLAWAITWVSSCRRASWLVDARFQGGQAGPSRHYADRAVPGDITRYVGPGFHYLPSMLMQLVCRIPVLDNFEYFVRERLAEDPSQDRDLLLMLGLASWFDRDVHSNQPFALTVPHSHLPCR